jgi:hypothetical protein
MATESHGENRVAQRNTYCSLCGPLFFLCDSLWNCILYLNTYLLTFINIKTVLVNRDTLL